LPRVEECEEGAEGGVDLVVAGGWGGEDLLGGLDMGAGDEFVGAVVDEGLGGGGGGFEVELEGDGAKRGQKRGQSYKKEKGSVL
jgi:hypothetical protein